MKTKDFDLSVKEVSEAGKFSGYASVFGVVDSYGEKVAPGAFVESLASHRRSGTMPLMLWQHDPYSPIGVWEDFAEDGKGLRASGRLLKGVAKADEAHILLRERAVRGLSIGYREQIVEPDGENKILRKLDLIEVSIVSIPANKRATVDEVKGDSESFRKFQEFCRRLRDSDPPPAKDFEGILRDADVPKSMATKIAAMGYAKAIRSDSESEAAARKARFIDALKA